MDIIKIAYALPDNLYKPIEKITKTEQINEIRIRINKPLALLVKNKIRFLSKDGELFSDVNSNLILINENDITDVFARICEHSLYSREGMVNRGYLPMRKGCRAGICGSFCERDYNLRDVHSINIRIARQIRDVDLPVYYLMNKTPKSVLISGPPCSGKTTVLRELCRRFSNAMNNVCILDEKGEIAGDGRGDFELGYCTDVISYRDKQTSAQMGLKYMNPDIIAFDELAEDADVIKCCVKSGVNIFATIHAESINDTLYRLDKLNIDAASFDLIVLLDKSKMSISDSMVTGV